MKRRSFLGALMSVIGAGQARSAEPNRQTPPVPSWRPTFGQPLDRVADRIAYYSDGSHDFTVFKNGTCVILEDGLSDEEATAFSLRVLADILNFHPDMNPTPMDDGNILVRYNHPAANVVLRDVARANWPEIEGRHLDGLAPSEVLMTPLGPNRFDDFGKQALLGRAYMFMDAQAPKLVEIRRHG